MQHLFNAIESSRHSWKGVLLSTGLYVSSRLFSIMGSVSLSSASMFASLMASSIVAGYTAWKWYLDFKKSKKTRK